MRAGQTGPGVCTQEEESALDEEEFLTPASEWEAGWMTATLAAATSARQQGCKGGPRRATAAPPPLPPAPARTRQPTSVFAALQREVEDASPRWLESQFKMQRKLLPRGEAEEPRANDVVTFFADMLRQPFPRVWAHAASGSPQVQWCHSLFKLSNPVEEDDA